MKISPRGDLGLQLLALYLLFVGPVVIASLVLDRYSSQRLVTDAKATDLALARAIARETSTSMEHALLSIEHLAAYPEVFNADRAGMERLFATLMSALPDVNLVYRLNAQGIMVFHYPVGPGTTVGVDFSFRDYYQKALTTDRPFLSEGRISPTTEQPVASAVMPIWDAQGNFNGLVATNIKLQSLSDTLNSIVIEHPAEDQLLVQILDSAGNVIAHPNPEFPLTERPLEQSQVMSAVLAGTSGNLVAPDPGGTDTLFSYVPVPTAGWGVIVSRPTAVAFATPRAFQRGILLIIAVFLSIGLSFWIALSRQVLRPLERLASFSQMIGLEKDLPPEQRQAISVMSGRSDQLGRLVHSLSRMEEAIQARLAELSTLLETSAAVVSTLNPQTVLERILEQVEHLLKIEKCSIVALDERRGVFRAQASRGLSRRYTEQIHIDPDEPQSVALRAIRTGQPIQISDTETDPTYTSIRPRAQAEGFRSILAVPLNTQHAPPSALVVYHPEPHMFSEREINLLTSFANHAAMAIENAALFANSDTRLMEQTRRLEALIQSMQDGLILEDLQGRVIYANRRIEELFELSVNEISGSPVEKLLDRLLAQGDYDSKEDQERAWKSLQASLKGHGQRSVEIKLRDARRWRYLRLLVFDVTDSKGMPIGRGQILRDITASRELDQMKSSLISTVSHELRTPLAAIKGYTTTLLADDVEWDLPAQREFLEIISAETDRLTDLVNELLDMSRIETGSLTVSRVTCHLEELVRRAAQRSRPAPGDRLQIQLPADLPLLLVDAQRIESVLRNLIENAAKYAGDDSPIQVTASIQGNDVIVRVRDHGTGIPAEHSERIFESFYRVESGLVRGTPGAGMGLAICQGFVRAHGGEIWLESSAKGACFAFSIPLLKEELPI
jgi:PAS domain S-box-containing protein